jgi:hypothetical protein
MIDSTIHRDCHKMYPRTFSSINLVSSPTQTDMSHDGVQDEPQLLKRIGIECEHAKYVPHPCRGSEGHPDPARKNKKPTLVGWGLEPMLEILQLGRQKRRRLRCKTVTVSSKAVRIAMVVLSASTCPALTPSASSHLVCEDVNLHMQTLICGRKNVKKYQTRVFSKATYRK